MKTIGIERSCIEYICFWRVLGVAVLSATMACIAVKAYLSKYYGDRE